MPTLHSALADPYAPPLPPGVADLLRGVQAPPRLVAHLRLVHEVAGMLVAWVGREYPDLVFDAEAVLFGAATHDVGKALHRAELSGPGAAHEEAGRELLLAAGYERRLARFAATHASWASAGVGFEDLLVSLADKVWKGKRVAELEDLVVLRLVAASGREVWAEFLALDDFLSGVAEGAGRRLAVQAVYPVGV